MRLPRRVYVVSGLTSGGLNLLLAGALGHPLGWVLSVAIGAVVGLYVPWSYLRRCERAAGPPSGNLQP